MLLFRFRSRASENFDSTFHVRVRMSHLLGVHPTTVPRHWAATPSASPTDSDQRSPCTQQLKTSLSAPSSDRVRDHAQHTRHSSQQAPVLGGSDVLVFVGRVPPQRSGHAHAAARAPSDRRQPPPPRALRSRHPTNSQSPRCRNRPAPCPDKSTVETNTPRAPALVRRAHSSGCRASTAAAPRHRPWPLRVSH